MIKLTIETQSAETGLWQTQEEIEQERITGTKEVNRQFLFWRWTEKESVWEETSESELRRLAANIAQSLMPTHRNVRIRRHEQAVDDYLLCWYPPAWAREIWRNNNWL